MVKIKSLQSLEATSWTPTFPAHPLFREGWEGEGDIFLSSTAFPLLFILFYSPCTPYIHLNTRTHEFRYYKCTIAVCVCVHAFN